VSLQRLKWLALLAPLAFFGALEVLRATLQPELFRSWPGYVLTAGIVLVAALAFAEAIFAVIGRMQERLALQNRELLALHEAGLAVVSELDLDTVLQKIVEQAGELVGARYGALSLLGEAGGIESFLTSGITPQQRARIGALPVGQGLLGVVLREGQRLRVGDVSSDPRSVGFPPHHPPMSSLLAVPILARGGVVGNLYLTEQQGQHEFSAEDEETLARFATQAAVAIENARLHRQVQAVAITEERERIAREMHDSLAQVLGYVNTKAQAAQEFIEHGQPERAGAQVAQLAEAARSAYADVRESILGLRTSLTPERRFLDALKEYMERWQEQSGVAVELEVSAPDALSQTLSPAAEVQLLRIVQEALSNVRKHARAAHAHVLLKETDGWVEVVVQDDGIGFDPTSPGRGAHPRFGLATMRERAETVGGELAIDSAPRQGARLTARIPTLGTSQLG
jgi:nitrate/nitrite-specific signal transduction histidine kinase